LWCVAAALAAAAGAETQTVGNDVRILCKVQDHEIFGNTMTWQLLVPGTEASNQHAMVRRMAPAPPIMNISESTVFAGPTVDLGGGLASISDSRNGPEFGFGPTAGTQVVFSAEDPNTHNFYIGRSGNACPQLDDGCWISLPFPNPDPAENRWHALATTTTVPTSKIIYFHSPGPRDTDVHIAWRDLEDTDLSHEQILDDPNAVDFSAWALINNEYFMVLQYGPPDGDQQVALYDVTPPYQNPRLKVVTSGPGVRSEAAIRVDPASGRYTLFAVNDAGGGANVMEIYQRIAGVWTHLYDFDAAQAGEGNPLLAYVQSPEPFVYRNRLYLAFVTADTSDFSTLTKGNIRITRIDPGGQPPTFFKLLSDASLERKRFEPEIHFPTNDRPVVFYVQRTEVQGEDGCNANSATLRRARTGLPRTN